MKKLFFLVCIILSCYPIVAQQTDSVSVVDTVQYLAMSDANTIEIYKTSTNRTFQILPGRKVWVYCVNHKDKLKYRRCTFVGIQNGEMVFIPENSRFKTTHFTPDDLGSISFSSTGRVLVAGVSNVLIVAAATVLIVTWLFIEALSGGTPGTGDLSWVPLVPFRKNISLHQPRKGKSWEIRLIISPGAGALSPAVSSY